MAGWGVVGLAGLDDVLGAVGIVVDQRAREDDAPVRTLAVVAGQALEQGARVGVLRVGLEADGVTVEVLVAALDAGHRFNVRGVLPGDLRHVLLLDDWSHGRGVRLGDTMSDRALPEPDIPARRRVRV